MIFEGLTLPSFDFISVKNVFLNMALESYKKWTIIILILIVFGFVIFALTRSYYKTEKPSDMGTQKTPIFGPLPGSEIKEVIPLEQPGMDTENPEALAFLGDRYFENSQFDQALLIYERVLELNPNDVDTYNDKGLALHHSGRSDIAIETLRKGTEVDPSYQRIWLSLGYVLTVSGKNEEAKTALKKAVEINPDSNVGQEAQKILGRLKQSSE